jgi:hypothetical protein
VARPLLPDIAPMPDTNTLWVNFEILISWNCALNGFVFMCSSKTCFKVISVLLPIFSDDFLKKKNANRTKTNRIFVSEEHTQRDCYGSCV